MVHIGKNITFLRKMYQLTQAEMCATLAFKTNTLSNWENGVSTPDIETLLVLSEYFNVGLSEFITSDLSKLDLIPNKELQKKLLKPDLKPDLKHDLKHKKAPVLGAVSEPPGRYGVQQNEEDIYQEKIALKDQIIEALKGENAALKAAISLANEQIKYLSPVKSKAG